MKSFFLKLAESLLRRLLGATRGLWLDLRQRVQEMDHAGVSAEMKHSAIDTWLAGKGFTNSPIFRRRLIQAAVLVERLDEILASRN